MASDSVTSRRHDGHRRRSGGAEGPKSPRVTRTGSGPRVTGPQVKNKGIENVSVECACAIARRASSRRSGVIREVHMVM